MLKLFGVLFSLSAALIAAVPASAQSSQEGQQTAAQVANGIAAVVEDRIITMEEVRRPLAPLLPRLQREARDENEFRETLRAHQAEVVQMLVDRALIVKHFQNEGGVVPQSIVEGELKQRIRQDFDGDRRAFLQELQRQGQSIREFRKIIEEDIILEYMYRQMLRSQSIVSPEKMEQYYQEKKHTFFQDEAVHLRIIQLTSLTSESEDVLLQTAEKVIRELQEGESFADLAERYSQARSRREGGSLGWMNTADMRDNWREAVADLKKGEVSDPIRDDRGIFLLYVEDRREAGIQPIHEVRDQIEAILVRQMARDAQERWLERLRRNAYVRFYI